MSATEVHNLLFRGSGLKGVSGLSNDMRTLLASDAPAASLAVDLYVHRAVREIGAIAAEIAGVDALVFTAGVGENAPEVRARIVEGCRWLGAELDPARNAAHHWKISPDGAKVAAYVVPTNEEAVIAGEMRTLLL
jgi:acetate kinase